MGGCLGGQDSVWEGMSACGWVGERVVGYVGVWEGMWACGRVGGHMGGYLGMWEDS